MDRRGTGEYGRLLASGCLKSRDWTNAPKNSCLPRDVRRERHLLHRVRLGGGPRRQNVDSVSLREGDTALWLLGGHTGWNRGGGGLGVEKMAREGGGRGRKVRGMVRQTRRCMLLNGRVSGAYRLTVHEPVQARSTHHSRRTAFLPFPRSISHLETFNGLPVVSKNEVHIVRAVKKPRTEQCRDITLGGVRHQVRFTAVGK